MEETSWVYRVINEETFHIVKEETNILHRI